MNESLRYWLLAFFLVASIPLRAQTVSWEKLFGTNAAAVGMQQTSDGGYIIVGYQQSGYRTSMYVVKTDASGNKVWDKTYGGTNPDGYDNAYAYSIATVFDGGYVIAGTRASHITIMRLSSTGDSVWSKDYNDAGDGNANAIIRTSDNGYAVTGQIYSQPAGRTGIFLMKIDATGAMAWQTIHGGAQFDDASSVRAATDGGFYVVGSYGVVDASDVYLLKTDANGVKVWDRKYPGIHSPSDYDYATDVRTTADGGLIITGHRAVTTTRYDTDVFLLKTDGSGVKQWESAFGGVGYDGGNSVIQTGDGGYAITGYDAASLDPDVIKSFVLKTNASGIKEWDFMPRDGYGHAIVEAGTNYAIAGGAGTQAYLAKVTPGTSATPRYFLLRDARDRTIPNQTFDLYRGTMQPGDDHKIATATTDAQGRILIDPSWYDDDDTVRIAKIVFTQSTLKPDHEIVENMAYRVMLDNVRYSERTSLPLTAAMFDLYDDNVAVLEQTIRLAHTTVLYDLVVSIEWDANDAFIAEVGSGLRIASNYLYDCFDGQVALGKVVVVEDKTFWNGADVLITASTETWPHAGLEGYRTSKVGDNQQVWMPRRWWGDPSLVRKFSVGADWLTKIPADNWRTLAHELGHQLFGFRDEYNNVAGTKVGEDYNLGFMDSHYSKELRDEIEIPFTSQLERIYASEMSAPERYRTEDRVNRQFVLRGSDCWTDFEKNYEKEYGGIFCPIVKPSEGSLAAGATMLQGPNNESYTEPAYDIASMMQTILYSNRTSIVQPLATISYRKDGAKTPVGKMKVVLKRADGTSLDLGLTNKDGKLRVLGAQTGDKYVASGTIDGKLLSSESTITLARKNDQKPTLASADSIDTEMHIALGTFTFVPHLAYRSDGKLDIGFGVNAQHTQDPRLHFDIDTTRVVDIPFTFVQSDNAYVATIDSLPGVGHADVTAYDEAREPIPFFLDFSTVEFSSELFGGMGGARLYLDSANRTTIARLSWLSSGLPSPTAGLDANALRGGDVHALALAPGGQVMTGANQITIRYANDDMRSVDEQTLRIYKWDASLRAWSKVGGEVDTTHNEVTASITSAGTYAAFTTDGSAGADANGDARGSLSMNTVPDRGQTTIDVTMQQSDRVTIEVFSMLGQLVRVVASEEIAAGRHRFSWSHVGVPSGVYFCVARASNASCATRVEVVR